MEPGSAGNDFPRILSVMDWVRQKLVLVHKDTPPKGISGTSQGAHFIDAVRTGEYFYLCHGNQTPSILLLGQFSGPANLFSNRGKGWTDRPFRWIKTAVVSGSYSGYDKWWAPSHNSTFVAVPDEEVGMFESAILIPYFEMSLGDFGIEL